MGSQSTSHHLHLCICQRFAQKSAPLLIQPSEQRTNPLPRPPLGLDLANPSPYLTTNPPLRSGEKLTITISLWTLAGFQITNNRIDPPRLGLPLPLRLRLHGRIQIVYLYPCLSTILTEILLNKPTSSAIGSTKDPRILPPCQRGSSTPIYSKGCQVRYPRTMSSRAVRLIP